MLFAGLSLCSCFVRINQHYFRAESPLHSVHTDFNRDSIRFVFGLTPSDRNVVLPLYIYKGSRKQYKIWLSLKGKGISAREYRVSYRYMEIKEKERLLARSRDTSLFKDEVQHHVAKDAISAVYATTENALKMPEGKKTRPTLHIDLKITNKLGVSDTFHVDLDLKMFEQKSFTLFKPIKK